MLVGVETGIFKAEFTDVSGILYESVWVPPPGAPLGFRAAAKKNKQKNG